MAENRNAVASVKIEGIEVQATVRRVEIEDGDRAIDKATIELDDARETASAVFREGNVVKIDMGWANEHAVLFEGVLRRVHVEAQARALQRVRLEAYDLSYRLQSEAHTAHHTGTLSTILRTLVTSGNSGITVGQIEPDPDSNYTEQAPLRQVNSRDWDFIQQMALATGSRAFVEHNDGASKFYFLPVRRLVNQQLGVLQYNCGLSRLLEFNYQRTRSAAAPQQQADSTHPQSGEAAQGRPQPATPEPPARPNPETLQRLSRTGGAETYEAAHATTATAQPDEQRPRGRAVGLPSSPERAEQAARPDPTLNWGYLGEGTAVGNIQIRAKGIVTIEGIATWAEGDWYVCQVNHVYERVVQDGNNRSTYHCRFRATR